MLRNYSHTQIQLQDWEYKSDHHFLKSMPSPAVFSQVLLFSLITDNHYLFSQSLQHPWRALHQAEMPRGYRKWRGSNICGCSSTCCLEYDLVPAIYWLLKINFSAWFEGRATKQEKLMWEGGNVSAWKNEPALLNNEGRENEWGKTEKSWFKYLISVAFAFEEETKALEHLLSWTNSNPTSATYNCLFHHSP